MLYYLSYIMTIWDDDDDEDDGWVGNRSATGGTTHTLRGPRDRRSPTSTWSTWTTTKAAADNRFGRRRHRTVIRRVYNTCVHERIIAAMFVCVFSKFDFPPKPVREHPKSHTCSGGGRIAIFFPAKNFFLAFFFVFFFLPRKSFTRYLVALTRELDSSGDYFFIFFFFCSFPNENHLSNELADRLCSRKKKKHKNKQKKCPNCIIIFIRHVLPFVCAIHNKVWACVCAYSWNCQVFI